MWLKNWTDFRISSKLFIICRYENSTPWLKRVSMCCFSHLCIQGGTTTSLYSIKCIDWPEILENSVFMNDFCQNKNFHTDKIRPILPEFRNLSNFSIIYNFSPVCYPNGCDTLIVILSALYIYNLLWDKRTAAFILEYPVYSNAK